LNKLEHQRRNPHLYTTLNQSVNADGSITTFDDITRGLQKALSAMDIAHINTFGGPHPVYCLRPIIGNAEYPVCQMIEMINEDMDKCRLGFIKNYQRTWNEARAKHTNLTLISKYKEKNNAIRL